MSAFYLINGPCKNKTGTPERYRLSPDVLDTIEPQCWFQNTWATRKACVRKRRLDDPELKAHVSERLLCYWSPEQIAGRLKYLKSPQQISFSTIYRGISNGLLEVPKKCLRRARRGLSPHTDEKRGRLHGYKTIHERPKAADDRSQYGHYEGDTVRGALSKGAAATFVDRKSGYLVAIVMPDRKAKTLNKAMQKAFAEFPAELLQSFTMDHSNEFFAYQQIEAALGTKVYFAKARPVCYTEEKPRHPRR